MKAIITGGAGFIGSNLTKLLLDKEWAVDVIDDFSVGSFKNLPKDNKKLKIIKANICNKEKMLSVIKNADVVFHLAVQSVRKSINDPHLVHEVNTGGTLNILEASKQNKIKKFVYVSSSESYGSAIEVPMKETHPLNPTTIYGSSKLAGEYYTLSYLKTYGLQTLVVRPFNTYGYNSHFKGTYGEVIPRFFVRALSGKSLQIFGDGKQTRDFTFVADSAKGIYLAYKKGKAGEIYNIARGKEITINEIAKLVLKVTESDSKIDHLKPRPGDVRRHYADINKAKKDLGFEPKIDIKDGLLKYYKWFIKRHLDTDKLLKLYEEKNW